MHWFMVILAILALSIQVYVLNQIFLKKITFQKKSEKYQVMLLLIVSLIAMLVLHGDDLIKFFMNL